MAQEVNPVSVGNACPICGSDAEIYRCLTAGSIQKHLAEHYRQSPPAALEPIDYRMARCSRCTLQFAIPMTPGNDAFYDWVTKQPHYYPDAAVRWEWQWSLEAMKERKKMPASVLEVGCGSGAFLEMTRQYPGIRGVGIDLTPNSVDECRAKGLEVHCETVQSFLETCNERFDYVVAFHTLEHVSDPRGFVAAMLSALKAGGSLFLSTPFSPMSFETLWFDPMNHPPHHMTRWNEASYRELARQLGLESKIWMPAASNPLLRAIRTVRLVQDGPARAATKLRTAAAAVRRPAMTFNEWTRQKERETVNGQAAADAVLVEMWRL